MVVKRDVYEFEWDKGNIGKNFIKHKVTNEEAEEVFVDKEKIIFTDVFHSDKEERFVLIGKTKNSRVLYIVFTKRDKKNRIISARDINKKEVSLYEEAIKVTKI